MRCTSQELDCKGLDGDRAYLGCFFWQSLLVISIRPLADDKHVGDFAIWVVQAVFIFSRILSPKNEKVFLCVVANACEYRTLSQAY